MPVSESCAPSLYSQKLRRLRLELRGSSELVHYGASRLSLYSGLYCRYVSVHPAKVILTQPQREPIPILVSSPDGSPGRVNPSSEHVLRSVHQAPTATARDRHRPVSALGQ